MLAAGAGQARWLIKEEGEKGKEERKRTGAKSRDLAAWGEVQRLQRETDRPVGHSSLQLQHPGDRGSPPPCPAGLSHRVSPHSSANLPCTAACSLTDDTSFLCSKGKTDTYLSQIAPFALDLFAFSVLPSSASLFCISRDFAPSATHGHCC